MELISPGNASRVAGPACEDKWQSLPCVELNAPAKTDRLRMAAVRRENPADSRLRPKKDGAVTREGAWSGSVYARPHSNCTRGSHAVSLAIKIGDEDAGTLTASPALPVGPESADIATIKLTPTSAARIAMADALASRQTISYSLDGTVGASADGRQRTFQLERRNQLNPVPGLPGVLR
jgi:hypothetical protein